MLAVGLMLTITAIHGCFLRTGILIQNILGWIKLALVAFMVVASAFVVATGYRPSPSSPSTIPLTPTTTFWSSIWEGSVWNWGVISTALFKVFYSYAGLQNANNVVNEIVNPVRTLKTAATTALVASCILYFLVNVAYFLVVPLEEIKESRELVAALFFSRLFGHNAGSLFLSLAVAVSAAGNVMVVTFALVSPSPPSPPKQKTLTPHISGPPKPRNRSRRLPPLRVPPLLHTALWRPARRSHCPLHPLHNRYLHPRQEYLQFHYRRRGIPGAVLLAGVVPGADLAALEEARFKEAV